MNFLLLLLLYMKINIKLNQFYISSGWVRWGGIKLYQNYLKPVTSFKKKSQIRSKFVYLNFKLIPLEMKQIHKKTHFIIIPSVNPIICNFI